MEKKGVLQIYVDAGFRESEGQSSGSAGLGVWIPALGTGAALKAAAADNNEAESLAIFLGVVIGKLMSLSHSMILTDSRVNCDRIGSDGELAGVLRIVRGALQADGVGLEWRAREMTSLADFFASLALEGKSLVATASNAKNPADKFRPLLQMEHKSKVPLKDATVKWLSLPSVSKAGPDFEKTQLSELVPDIASLMGTKIPESEFQVLIEHFWMRAQKARTR
jgi:hypothetical protein